MQGRADWLGNNYRSIQLWSNNVNDTIFFTIFFTRLLRWPDHDKLWLQLSLKPITFFIHYLGHVMSIIMKNIVFKNLYVLIKTKINNGECLDAIYFRMMIVICLLIVHHYWLSNNLFTTYFIVVKISNQTRSYYLR